MRRVGLLAIGIVAFAATVHAVPRYSASVNQVGDSPVVQTATKSAGAATQNQSTPVLQKIKQEALSCKDEWSGSLDDLKTLVGRAKQKYGNESTKHMGRNATMIVPANLSEMKRWGEETWKDRMKQLFGLGDKSLGNFRRTIKDGYHVESAKKDDGKISAALKTVRNRGANMMGKGIEKYQVEAGEFKGAEVVYNIATGEIIKDWRMGTRNYSYVVDGSHTEPDVDTHEENPEYKYVGILVETDPSDPNKYYIVNGQTGKRMTWREAEDFPTTLSDEWKDMGLACVPDDANDVIEPDECRDEAKCVIDTSKLEKLMNQLSDYLEKLIANGRHASEEEMKTFGGYLLLMVDESKQIENKVDEMVKSGANKSQLERNLELQVSAASKRLEKLWGVAEERGVVTKDDLDATVLAFLKGKM